MSKHRPAALAQLVWHDLVFDDERVLYECEYATFHAAVRAGKAALPVLIAQTGGRPEDYALVVRGTNGRVRFRWQVPAEPNDEVSSPAPLGPRSRLSPFAS